MKLTGAQIVWESLIRLGVKYVYGIPGGVTLPLYDALPNYAIHHVLARQEQGAVHMANGYARTSGKVGVALVTSGPGATNAVTGIATAMMDSIPVVVFTGQVVSGLLGTDAFQETDITGVTLPITKHNYLVTKATDVAHVIREAFFIASSGRPGPVVIDITKDAQTGLSEFDWESAPLRLPGYRPDLRAHAEDINQAIELINSASRPVILAGHGILISGARKQVLKLAERAQIPMATTLLGLGAIPDSHQLNIGYMGMHGEAAVNKAIQEADLLLAFGMRFDDRVTGTIKTYAPNARKVHIDIDPTEINKVVKVDVGIIGDLKKTLEEIIPSVKAASHAAWLSHIEEMKKETEAIDILHQPDNGKLYVAHVIHDICEIVGTKNVIVATDVGQHQMWTAQYFDYEEEYSLITSGGLGTMGFGLPSGIGAKMGQPDKEVWVMAGDGGFQMTFNELAVTVQENVKVNVCILNNSFLGMIRQWQELFYGERYSASPMLSPDFVKIAEAYGLKGIRVTKRSEIKAAVEEARACPTTVVIDFRVESHDVVYPMVPAGAALHDMIRRPGNNK